MRRELPTRRESWTQKVRIDTTTIYLKVGEYDDGTPAEVFLYTGLGDSSDELRGWLNCFAIAVSLGLQHGVPLELFVRNFRGTRFGTAGVIVGSETIKGIASSIADWIARELEAHYDAAAEPEAAGA